MKRLQHNDKVRINGKKGHVFTVKGYAKQYNDDVEEVIERARKNGHILYCIQQEPAMLCADPTYYQRKRIQWENAIELIDGEIVEIEDKYVEVKYMGNYSDMVHFKEI